MRRFVAALVVFVVVGFGAAPAGAEPTPTPGPVATEWYEPLPGYDPSQPLPEGPWEAFTYEAAPHLLPYADQDPPKAAELADLKDKKKYTYGTRDYMFADWRDRLREFPANLTAAQLKLRWRAFVKGYVRGKDSNARGAGFAAFVFRKVGIAGSPDYRFDVPSSVAPIKPDADPVNPRLKRGYEVMDSQVIQGRKQAQLDGYVQQANATGRQYIYVFRVKPKPSALQKIDDANRATRFNAGLAKGATPYPAIVARIMPAVPQPVPMKEDLGSPGPTATGNAPAGTGGPAPVQPKGGGGVMVAPGSGQLPVDGGLADETASSPDSPEEAAAENGFLDQFAAELGDEDMPSADPLGGVDFSTLELHYVSDTYQGGSGLGFAFSAKPAPADQASYGGQRAALQASDAFFVWLALPTEAFTVNLNPDEPDRVMDARFGRTDAGRVLLEADLQMKKTVAKLIHPDTAAGTKFWNALQGEQKCISMRQWIVPGPASVREDGGQLYIISAPLQVKLETDYTKTAGVGGAGTGCPGQGDAETQHNEDVFRSTILPQVQFAVNYAPEYADLRRVYVSRVAAQWYRERSKTKHTAYSDLVDRGDASDWPLRAPWTPKETFDRYVDSYTKGEFKVTRTTDQGNVIVTETYVYGGVDLTNIPRAKMSASSFTSRYKQLPDTVNRAAYSPTNGEDGKQVWLGGLSTARPLPELQAGAASPTSRADFWIVTLLPLLVWASGGVLLLIRRQRRHPAAPTPSVPVGS